MRSSSSQKRKLREKQALKNAKMTKQANTSIYRKNKALKHMNDIADNESCSSSALLAEALDELAIA